MTRLVAGIAAVWMAILGLGCSDDRQSPFPGSSFTVEAPGPYSFTVSGVSYGPNEEEYMPPNCTRGNELRRDTKIFVRSSGDTVKLPSIAFGTWGTSGTACALEVDSGGSAYNGGTVLVDATIEGTTQGLGNVPGDFTEIAQTFDVPTDATITMRVIVNEGFQFLYWTIKRADGSGYRAFGSTLARSATSGDVEFLAEFQQGSTGGNPPPPPPPSKCDDPSVPGCEPTEPPASS